MTREPASERIARLLCYLILAALGYAIWNGDMIRAAIFNH